jgi:hypothetical protein
MEEGESSRITHQAAAINLDLVFTIKLMLLLRYYRQVGGISIINANSI